MSKGVALLVLRSTGIQGTFSCFSLQAPVAQFSAAAAAAMASKQAHLGGEGRAHRGSGPAIRALEHPGLCQCMPVRLVR